MKKIAIILIAMMVLGTPLFAGTHTLSTSYKESYPDRIDPAASQIKDGETLKLEFKKAETIIPAAEANKKANEAGNVIVEAVPAPVIVPASKPIEEPVTEPVVETPPAEPEPVAEETVPVEPTLTPTTLTNLSSADLDFLIDSLLDEKNKREGQKTIDKDAKWWEMPVEKPELNYDVFARTTMIRDTNFAFGGGGNIGVLTNSFRFELYGAVDYFMKPIGGSPGGAANLEIMLEAGATFAWKFMEVWRTRTYIELDVGYFAQLAKIPQQPSNLFVGFNGIMMRPKVVTHLQLTKGWDFSLGLYYQVPLYPSYDDYKGLGIIFGFV